MDVILLERIDKLGQMGDVVRVKNGHARNFLLPQKKALRATAQNKTYFEGRRAELEAVNLEHKQEAEAVAKKLSGYHVILVRQAGEGGQLYGSVTPRDIADGLKEEGVKMDRGQVELKATIKKLGQHNAAIKLHPEVTVEISVTVARSKEEADISAAVKLLERQEDAEKAIEKDQEEKLKRTEELKMSKSDDNAEHSNTE
jgi:large subunit ribosomal protein L9